MLDLLASLVDKSLILRADPCAGEPRFGMLATVREYALEQLAANGVLEEARGRHAEIFAALAAQAQAELLGPRQASWLDRLDAEYDNLRAALAWLVEASEAERGLRMGWNLFRFWLSRCYLAEGRAWLARLLSMGDEAARATSSRPYALLAAGRLAFEQGDYAEARASYEEALVILRAVEDRPFIATALTQLGHVALVTGDHVAARALYDETLAIRRDLVDRGDLTQRSSLAISLKSLGRLAFDVGDPAGARRFYEEALAIERELGHRWEMALTLYRLGEVAADRSDLAQARSRYRECLTIARELGDRHRVADALEGFAALAAPREAERAVRLDGAAAALREAIGAPSTPAERERLDRRLAPARRALGPGAAALLAEGRAMSPDEAIDYALAGEPRSERDDEAFVSTPLPPEAAEALTAAHWGSLTPREREVVALVAQGRTNRQIAGALVISERTVARHLDHVFAKVGVSSRTAVAAFALRHGLA